ncbi:MAG: tRNA uridine-5-carboxymethylaminomethyl(34) synthesis GTPase MnmE [Lachnospiraceae bacterium]|nr:tRNA uridine-5-carboxymethylaminomethyl(34) synthesis GTPase MnmE [Lachnospiraceae bacterium]
MRFETETIAAIATAMSNSGIGIIRISGDEAIDIADKIFRSVKTGKKLKEVKSHTIHFGHIVDGDNVLDEVLVSVMRGPNTYTCEDVVEINCHGGVIVLKKVLGLILKNGARPADAGEFTKRAFLNGRIDLSQAEAVIDVINAKNEYALSNSVSQLKGGISTKIKEIRDSILNEIAFIEAALDDPEHMSLDGYDDKLCNITKNIIDELNKLIMASDNGRVISEGIKTVILGKPNAGKSSFLNAVVGTDRAIVTDIAGTTRDTLEEHINIDGISLNIIDTAGIRDTSDVVESIGVKKAKDLAIDADLIIYIIDSSKELDDNDKDIMEIIKGRKAIVLFNKSDLVTKVTREDIAIDDNISVINISAKNQTGITEFEESIKDMFFNGELEFNDEVFITNARQKNDISQAYESMKLVLNSVEAGMPEDFYTIDLMNAYELLGRVVGEAIEDDLVDKIFSKFCMGK